MEKKEALLKAISLGIGIGMSMAPALAGEMPKPGEKYVPCFGINTCKGSNACGVKNAQIKAANKAYNNKYKNSKALTCSSQSECSAAKGHLAWIAKPTDNDCLKEGGFLIEKGAKGKLTIRDKDGKKSV